MIPPRPPQRNLRIPNTSGGRKSFHFQHFQNFSCHVQGSFTLQRGGVLKRRWCSRAFFGNPSCQHPRRTSQGAFWPWRFSFKVNKWTSKYENGLKMEWWRAEWCAFWMWYLEMWENNTSFVKEPARNTRNYNINQHATILYYSIIFLMDIL